MRLAGVPLLATSLVAALPVAATTQRFGVIAGNNRGAGSARLLRWAEQDAQRLHDLLLELGDFTADNLRLVIGGDDAAVRAGLAGDRSAAGYRHRRRVDPVGLLLLRSRR